MTIRSLIVVLGDQLNSDSPAFDDFDRDLDGEGRRGIDNRLDAQGPNYDVPLNDVALSRPAVWIGKLSMIYSVGVVGNFRKVTVNASALESLFLSNLDTEFTNPRSDLNDSKI